MRYCVPLRVAALHVFLGIVPVFAAPVASLDKVVVSAARTERALAEVPVRTEVIDAEQIKQLHARDLQEALQYVPGLQLRPLTGKTGYGVWLQGIDANRVLILVDGNPVSASTGSAVDTTQIAVTDIERIEVVKGAVSALYGTSAMGGVINIITRQQSEPVSAAISLSGGSWGDQNSQSFPLAQRHLQAQAGMSREKWSVNVHGDIRDQDGWQTDPDSTDAEGYEGNKSNLGMQWQYRFSPQLVLSISPGVYYEDLTNAQSEFVPGVGSLQINKNEKTNISRLAAKLEKKSVSALSWSVSAMGERYDGETQQDKTATAFVDQQRDTVIDQQQLGGQFSLPLGNNLLTVGAQWSQGSMDVEQEKRTASSYQHLVEVDNEQAESQEFFVQNSWFAGDWLELMPGFRVHNDSEAGVHVSPMLNSMAHKDFANGDRLNIRLGVGNGYRVPNLKERYFVFDHSTITSSWGYMLMGNPDLKPESSVSIQTGLEWLMSGGSRAEFSAFYNDINDMIVEDLDPSVSTSALSIYRYQNIEQAMTMGAEFVWYGKLTENLVFDAAYTWMETEDKKTGKALPSRPKHQVKLGLDWQTPVPNLGMLLQVRYEARQYADSSNTGYTPAFTVVDVKANYDIGNQWRLFAGINNLTDEQKDFTRVDNRPEEARFIYLGARWQY